MQTHHEEEFTAFATTRHERLRRTARLLTLDQAQADDLVQQTLIRVFLKWSLVSAAQDPDAYVRRIMVNENIAMARRSSTGRRPLPDAEPSLSMSFADAVEARHEAVRLLRLLPLRQRAALAFRYLEDLDDASIAEALGCRRSTVRSLVRRGLETIRNYEPSDPNHPEVKREHDRTART